LFLDLGTTALGREIKNSPLADQSTSPEVRFGYLYRF
jgi:outer membrane protein